MNWLERNVQLLAEIQSGVRLQRGPVIGRSTKTTVTSLGAYRSNILERDLHLAIKGYGRTGINNRLMDDLAFVDCVSHEIPNLEPEFPLVLGLLKDGRNNTNLGILTEDFSQGGRLKIREVVDRLDFYSQALPRELLTMVGPIGLDEDFELGKVCFMLEAPDGSAQRRLGDFDSIRFNMNFNERFQKFPIDKFLDVGDIPDCPYTVTINYDL